jgi:hypothetical protein
MVFSSFVENGRYTVFFLFLWLLPNFSSLATRNFLFVLKKSFFLCKECLAITNVSNLPADVCMLITNVANLSANVRDEQMNIRLPVSNVRNLVTDM